MSKIDGTGRKNGEKQSHTFPVWNGLLEPKHLKRIGPALALFLWCVDKVTEERDMRSLDDSGETGRFGLVHGGKPFKIDEIAKDLGLSRMTARRYLERLAWHSYIEVVRLPYGLQIRVSKSAKFTEEYNHKRAAAKAQKRRTQKACSEVNNPECSEVNHLSNRSEQSGPERVFKTEQSNKMLQLEVDVADDFAGSDSTAVAAKTAPQAGVPSPSLRSNSESQNQENGNPFPTGKPKSPRPYTDALLRNGLGVAGLCEIPKSKRQYAPKTEAEIQEDLRKVREMFPEQFAKAEQNKVAAVGA